MTHAAEKTRRLKRKELPSDTVVMAKFLIGCTLVHDVGGERLAGRIVETEAYLTGDAASHAYRGLTKRNPSMFLRRGHAYVYISYGVWPMLNVSSMEEGIGEAVLIRALEPLQGIELMRARRGVDDLSSGPGKLTQALGVSLEANACDLAAGPVVVEAPPPGWGDVAVAVGTRIGITKAAELPWRFAVAGNRYVSRPRPPTA